MLQRREKKTDKEKKSEGGRRNVTEEWRGEERRGINKNLCSFVRPEKAL